MLAEALISELQSWSSVEAKPGRSKKTADGLTNYVMIHRRKSGVGALLYVRPKSNHVRLRFRLPREYMEGRAHAYATGVSPKNPYQVEMKLSALDQIPEALDLANSAFENAG